MRTGHRAIVVAAGEQGDFTMELAQDDFSHDPPQVTDWGRGAAKARVSVDGTDGFCLVEIALDRVGSGDSCTECLDQFLDRLIAGIIPEILDLCLGETRLDHSDHSHRRSQRSITGTLIPKLSFQTLDLSLTAFQIGLGLLQGNLFSGHGPINQLIGLGRIELLKLQDRIEFRASSMCLISPRPCITLDSPFNLTGLGSERHRWQRPTWDCTREKLNSSAFTGTYGADFAAFLTSAEAQFQPVRLKGEG